MVIIGRILCVAAAYTGAFLPFVFDIIDRIPIKDAFVIETDKECAPPRFRRSVPAGHFHLAMRTIAGFHGQYLVGLFLGLKAVRRYSRKHRALAPGNRIWVKRAPWFDQSDPVGNPILTS